MVIKRTPLSVPGEQAHVIRFTREYAAQGFYAILNNGQARALPNNIYVVGDNQLRLLKKVKIPFEIVRETDL